MWRCAEGSSPLPLSVAEVKSETSRGESSPVKSQASSDGAEGTEASSSGATAVQEGQPGGESVCSHPAPAHRPRCGVVWRLGYVCDVV